MLGLGLPGVRFQVREDKCFARSRREGPGKGPCTKHSPRVARAAWDGICPRPRQWTTERALRLALWKKGSCSLLMPKVIQNSV